MHELIEHLGVTISGLAVFLARNGGEPTSPAMSDILLARVLLLCAGESTSDVIGESSYCITFLPSLRSGADLQTHQIFSTTFEMLAQLAEDMEDGEMPPLTQLGLMFVDWLDPQKTV